MEQFATVRAAKEYLIDRILRQAEQDGVSLTDVEQKMLYFSESGWTLPDMKTVSAEFDRDYSHDEYENKIARVVQHIKGSDTDRRSWNNALHRLQSEDHYLLVLIDGASQLRKSCRPPGDIWRLILSGCAIVIVPFALLLFLDSHGINKGVSNALMVMVLIILIGGAMYLSRRATR